MVVVDAPPVPGKQSMAMGESIALIKYIEYTTSLWRRDVSAIDDYHKAWLLWCYRKDNDYSHQIAITTWGWRIFQERIAEEKVAKKVVDRLKALLWLCAQDVKAEIFISLNNWLILSVGVNRRGQKYIAYFGLV